MGHAWTHFLCGCWLAASTLSHAQTNGPYARLHTDIGFWEAEAKELIDSAPSGEFRLHILLSSLESINVSKAEFKALNDLQADFDSRFPRTITWKPSIGGWERWLYGKTWFAESAKGVLGSERLHLFLLKHDVEFYAKIANFAESRGMPVAEICPQLYQAHGELAGVLYKHTMRNWRARRHTTLDSIPELPDLQAKFARILGSDRLKEYLEFVRNNTPGLTLNALTQPAPLK